jgi:hypothetical protein
MAGWRILRRIVCELLSCSAPSSSSAAPFSALVREGFLLDEDLAAVVARAEEHWNYAAATGAVRRARVTR